MHDDVKQQSFPRGALMAATLLIGFSLLAAGTARLLHVNATPMPVAQVVSALHLSFRDRSDGAVEVLDAARSDTLTHVFPPGTNGFVRGVLRGLARARRSDGIGAAPPFTLTRWSDGRLTLDDPETAQHVNLEVFGPTNAQPFVELFSADSVYAIRPADATARN